MSAERRCLVVGGDPAVAAGVVAVIESAPGLVCVGVLEPATAISGLRPVCDVIVACDAAGQTAIELAAPLIRTCGGVPVIVATVPVDVTPSPHRMLALRLDAPSSASRSVKLAWSTTCQQSALPIAPATPSRLSQWPIGPSQPGALPKLTAGGGAGATTLASVPIVKGT